MFVDGGTYNNGGDADVSDLDAVHAVNFGDGVRMIKLSGVGGSGAVIIVIPKIGKWSGGNYLGTELQSLLTWIRTAKSPF